MAQELDRFGNPINEDDEQELDRFGNPVIKQPFPIRTEAYKPSWPMMVRALLQPGAVNIERKLSEKYLLPRQQQMAGNEPGILNPNMEQNPLLLQSRLPASNVDMSLSPSNMAKVGYEAIIRPLASPLGLFSLGPISNPAKIPFPVMPRNGVFRGPIQGTRRAPLRQLPEQVAARVDEPTFIVDEAGNVIRNEPHIVDGVVRPTPVPKPKTPAEQAFDALIPDRYKIKPTIEPYAGRGTNLPPEGTPIQLKGGKQPPPITPEIIPEPRSPLVGASPEEIIRAIQIYRKPTGALTRSDKAYLAKIKDKLTSEQWNEILVKSGRMKPPLSQSEKPKGPIASIVSDDSAIPEFDTGMGRKVEQIKQKVGEWLGTRKVYSGKEPNQPPLDSPIPPSSRPAYTPPEVIVAQDTAAAKIIAATEVARPLRTAQDRIYAQERAQRFGAARAVKTEGEAGFREALSKMKGEHTKVHFESIRPVLDQTDIDALYSLIKHHPTLTDGQKFRAGTGLAKLLGEYGGVVPQPSELKYLSQILGPNIKIAAEGQIPNFILHRLRDMNVKAMNFHKGLMAIGDLSAPFRQGRAVAGTREWFRAYGDMFRSYGGTLIKKGWDGEKAFQDAQEALRQRPNFDKYENSGLALMDLAEDISKREEHLISPWPEHIPVYGEWVVRPSNRAYTAYLNRLRADLFDNWYDQVKREGLDIDNDVVTQSQLAEMINTLTGRGSLGKYERFAPELNSLMFSPRFFWSRLQLMNPKYYIDPEIPWAVKKHAVHGLLNVVAGGMAFTGLVKTAELAGLPVKTSLNPLNSDFGKVVIGKTRMDVHGGFQQIFVFTSRFLMGAMTSSQTGKTIPLNTGEFGRPTRMDISERFAVSKSSPEVGFSYRMGMVGTTPTGEPYSFVKERLKMFVPMMVQTLHEIAQEDPELLPFLIAPATFGVGVQTYTED